MGNIIDACSQARGGKDGSGRRRIVGELSEIMAKVFDGIQNLDRNGVLGDPRPATAEAGKKYLEDIIEFLYRWVGMQEKSLMAQ